MKITLLTVGKLKKKYYKQACDDYEGRLGHYCRFEVHELKAEPARSGRTADELKAKEGARILNRCNPQSYVIALDEFGQQWPTMQLSQFLEQRQLHGQKEIIFCIGGALGHAPEVLSRADHKMALSKGTLPHEMARLIVVEQLYRAHTILAGEPYHNP